jgi:branched-chain amino acid transport system permease protein
MNRLGGYKLGFGITILFLLLLLPFFLGELNINLAIEVLIYGLFAISFNLLLGYGGIMAFGHAGLFGVGGYVTGLVIKYFPGTPLVLNLVIALLCGFVSAIFIGFFVIRLKGAYGAMLSFAFQMFLYAVAWKWRTLTGGDDGIGITRPEIHLPGLGSVSLMNINNLYYLTLIIAAIAIFACYFFLKTPLGNSYVCTRENDIRASFLGYNVFLTRLVAFSFSGVLASVAGGLYVLFQEIVGTSCIDMNISLSVMVMTIIGGTGHFFGPVLGAAFYVIFQDWVSSLTSHWLLYIGIVFAVVVLYSEGGLIALFKNERIRFLVSRWGTKSK